MNGTWFSNDYTCGGESFPNQKFEVKSFEDTIFCVKLVGDPCIRSGDTTWFAFKMGNGNKWIGFMKGVNIETGHKHFKGIELNQLNTDTLLINIPGLNKEFLFYK